MKDLEAVLTEARTELAALSRNGASMATPRVEDLLREIEATLGEWTTWLTEEKAVFRSGKPARWFRSRFDEWEARGLAKVLPGRGRRAYRSAVVPLDPSTIPVLSIEEQAAKAARRVNARLADRPSRS